MSIALYKHVELLVSETVTWRSRIVVNTNFYVYTLIKLVMTGDWWIHYFHGVTGSLHEQRTLNRGPIFSMSPIAAVE